MSKKSAGTNPLTALSVVIPAYNTGPWLPRTVPRVADAIKRAGLKKAEIIIVNDGSSDDTESTAKAIKTKYPIRVISQTNSGRFIARHNGALQAKFDHILFIDTRVFIGETSLEYLVSKMKQRPERLVWTSHVYIDTKDNPYARFWEAITYIAWRKYFSNPRDCSFGLKDFDYYPKGTTCFFVPKKIILEANSWFEGSTKNARAANDDTLLIRHIAEQQAINLSPKFYCTYHARTNLQQFIKHVFYRGKFFVDGFLRRDGNRFYWILLAFLFLSASTPLFLIIFPQFIPLVVLLLAAAWVMELVSALLLGVAAKDALSFFMLSPVFVLIYGAGIWAAVFDIYLRRRLPT